MANKGRFRTHDHVDRDVIKINKDKLIRAFSKAMDDACVTRTVGPYAGGAFALLSSAILTETFHDIAFIPGETIRAVFIFGGLTLSILAVRGAFCWWDTSDNNSSEAIVERLAPTQKEDPSMTPLICSPYQTRFRMWP